MNPGKYNKRITFCDLIENSDSQGGAVITPAAIITVWASVVPFSSNQSLAYSQLTTQQGYNIECRSLKTVEVTTKNGILSENKILTIHSCIADGLMKLKIIAFEQ